MQQVVQPTPSNVALVTFGLLGLVLSLFTPNYTWVLTDFKLLVHDNICFRGFD